MKEKIKQMPKVDLHVHIDGSLRPETIRDLANDHGFELPTQEIDEIARLSRVPHDCQSLTEFLNAFFFFYPFLSFPDSVERMSYELCEDMAKDNVRYFEARFAPHLQENREIGFSAEDVVKCVLKGFERGKRDFKVHPATTICCYRNLEPETAIETVELAQKYRGEFVVGIDLAGDESKFKLEKHAAAFAKAREYGLPITVHAGEAAPAWSVWDALNAGANRIGHGVHIREDEKLYAKVIEEQIPVEINLTSNVQTCSVKGYDDHPFPEYYSKGMVTILCTDDPGVSDIDLSYEYGIAVEKYGLELSDLKQSALRGIEYAFCSDEIKKEVKGEIEGFDLG